MSILGRVVQKKNQNYLIFAKLVKRKKDVLNHYTEKNQNASYKLSHKIKDANHFRWTKSASRQNNKSYELNNQYDLHTKLREISQNRTWQIHIIARTIIGNLFTCKGGFGAPRTWRAGWAWCLTTCSNIRAFRTYWRNYL